MSQASRLAVELTKGEDFLDIWVDANNNGVRDDDDVNIYVSSSGHVFAESPAFKKTLDEHIKRRLEEASLAFIQNMPNADPAAEENICELALELVVKAITAPQAGTAELPPLPTFVHQAPAAAAPAQSEVNEFGIPMWKPQA